jgi:hypothetical protein
MCNDVSYPALYSHDVDIGTCVILIKLLLFERLL